MVNGSFCVDQTLFIGNMKYSETKVEKMKYFLFQVEISAEV